MPIARHNPALLRQELRSTPQLSCSSLRREPPRPPHRVLPGSSGASVLGSPSDTSRSGDVAVTLEPKVPSIQGGQPRIRATRTRHVPVALGGRAIHTGTPSTGAGRGLHSYDRRSRAGPARFRFVLSGYL